MQYTQLLKKLWEKQGLTLAEYNSIHYWLKYHYGKADKCENKNCKKESNHFNWSLIKGKKYERKRKNYRMLCRQCHAIEDLTIEGIKKLSIIKKGTHRWKNGICFAGHLLKDNIYYNPHGDRSCRSCRRANGQRLRNRRRLLQVELSSK